MCSYHLQFKFQNFTQIIYSTSSQIHAIRSFIIMRSTYLRNVLPHNNLGDTFMAMDPLPASFTSDTANQAVIEVSVYIPKPAYPFAFNVDVCMYS
jgi:hypothetical protein